MVVLFFTARIRPYITPKVLLLCMIFEIISFMVVHRADYEANDGVCVRVGNFTIYCLQYQALISINISIQHQLSSSFRVQQIQNNKFIPFVHLFAHCIQFVLVVCVFFSVGFFFSSVRRHFFIRLPR